jgi:hypothetical protein
MAEDAKRRVEQEKERRGKVIQSRVMHVAFKTAHFSLHNLRSPCNGRTRK